VVCVCCGVLVCVCAVCGVCVCARLPFISFTLATPESCVGLEGGKSEYTI